MAIFEYLAKDQRGQTIKGKTEAPDTKRAVKLLREQNLTIISLSPKGAGGGVLGSLKKLQGVGTRDKATFTRLFSTMMATGLPITQALSNLVAQTENPRFIEVLSEVLRDVEGGASLSTALSRHRDVFDEIYISLVKTGEAAGNLDKTLTRLAETLEKDREFKGKIKGALLYPVIVAIAMVGVGALMMVVVIPKISAVYEEANAALPLPTQMLIGFSNILRSSGMFLVAGLLGFFVFIRFFKKTKQGEVLFGDLSFKIPVFGELDRQVALTSLVRTLGVLVGSGIAILDALRLTAETLGHNVFRRGLEAAVSQVEKGLPLSIVLQANKDFPPIVGQMVTVGEETGTLDEILGRLSAYFETEAEYQIKNLTTALEPFIIILMGVAVAGLAAAVILPLFNLVNVIK
jgi:type IV pilus assembly protein PilC